MAKKFNSLEAIFVIAPSNDSAIAFLATLRVHLNLDHHLRRTVEIAEMAEILACRATEWRFKDCLDYMERRCNVPDELAIPAFKSWLAKERKRNQNLRTLFVSGAPATERQCMEFQELFDSISIIHLEPDIRRVRRVAASGNRRCQAYLAHTLPFMRKVPSMPRVREWVLTLTEAEPIETQMAKTLKHFLEQGVRIPGKGLSTRQPAFLGHSVESSFNAQTAMSAAMA